MAPRRARWLPTVAGFTAAAQLCGAQTVTGTVVQADSVTPLVAVIVVATDARGTTAARTLTGARGSFTMRLPAAGSYALAVLRIGYRPTVGPTVRVAEGDTTRVRIVSTRAAVSLAAVNVREHGTCRVDADTGLMVSRVWEEARKAMLTTQLTSGGVPLYAEWIEYDRTLDSTGRVVRQQHVRSSRFPTTHAFRSVSPEILRDQGYVVQDAVGVTYHAPDADVLLSDAFVSAHCFRLVESTEDRQQVIGVGFAPTRARRDMREIEGTLWVDRASSELRVLEFRYLNLPDPSYDADPGGRVEFRRLDDGNWLVSRWHLRMPRIAVRGLASADGTRRTIASRDRAYLQAVQVTGGEVTRATRGDSVILRTSGPGIRVQVTTSDSTMSVDDAMLTLEGTDYSANGDSSGQIQLTPVLAGRYRASVRTRFMELVGMPAVEREIETRDDAEVDSIALPTSRNVLASACARDSIRDGEGMLHGRVRDERGRPVPGMIVTTAWNGNFTILTTGSSASISAREKTHDARADAFGYWRVCGVPRDTPLRVSVTTDSTADVQTARLETRPFALVELVLHPRHANALDLTPSQRGTARALVEVVVTDERGDAVPDVTLEVRGTGAAARTVVTGASGRFLLAEVRTGSLTVAAKRAGFAPADVTVDVQGERLLLPIRLVRAR